MGELPTGTVTLLFTDIEESTRLLQRASEHYADVLQTYRDILRTVFHQCHGHEVDTQGDAFFVAFARATDAVSAAVTAQRALVSHPWSEGLTVRVRMGLHTDEPQRTAAGYVDLDVHHAARVMSVGHGGQVVLSGTTRELVEHTLPEGVTLRDLGQHRLKDLQHPGHLFQLVINDLPADFPPLFTLDSHPHNLPIQPTPFIGREREVAAVQQLLKREDVRLLTLTGPGGVGKTRLGLQVVAELSEAFADGLFFVNLAPIRDPEFVIPAIAQTLDLKEFRGQAHLDILTTALRNKRLMLILDNFEQVVDAAGQVAALLAACPNVKMVVTSRMPLHVQAEREFAVPPLALPDTSHPLDVDALSQSEAVALYIVRAQAVKPDFQVTNATVPAIAEMCVRLDGLPLPIELAAARVKLLPPQVLLARLSQRLQLLTGGARDVAARQQTLRNTLAWSYELLEVSEQKLFRRLSVFCGSCSLEAVEAVYAALDDEPGWVVEGVASLIDKSLLQGIEQEGTEARFFMLETIRDYGLEALAASREEKAVRQAHARHYLQFAEEAARHWRGADEQVWFIRLERDQENLRAAVHWLLDQKDAELALRLCTALWWFWEFRGYTSEGRPLLEKALAASEEATTSVRAEAFNGLGTLLMTLGDYEQSKRCAEKSLALYRELGETGNLGWPLHNLGVSFLLQGELSRAGALFEESLACFDETGDTYGRAYVLGHQAFFFNGQGEYDKARVCAQESLALFRKLEAKVGIIIALLTLAGVHFTLQDDVAEIDAMLEECLRLAKEVGDEEILIAALKLRSQIALYQDDPASARVLIEECLAFYKAKDYRADIADALIVLGQVDTLQGEDKAAQASYEESLGIAREIDYKLVIAPCLEGLAAVRAAQGAFAWATRLWGSAEALREILGPPLLPHERISHERAVAIVRIQLGEKNFVAAWAEGRAMTPEQVLAAQGQGAIAPEPPALSLPSYPDGLTAREVEVLQLVAQGLSNAEIADQLVISLLTVKAHVRSLYNKLGISSRSAATRYAIEHQLV